VVQATGGTLLLLDPIFVVTAILLLSTIATTILYYKRIRQVSRAYREAKDVVGDIVISFDKQLQRQGEQIGSVANEVETLTTKSERVSKRLDEQEEHFAARLADLTSKAAESSGIETVKKDLEDVKKQLEDLAKSQEELRERAVAMPESQIKTAIPIKRERALAPLTETELRVLEFIAEAGEKTAPDVKDMIKLTREHTARLMKKLYEGGYLERRSERTPYAYRVKEEMLKILKKSEVKA